MRYFNSANGFISLFYENKKYMTMQKYMLRKIANFAHSPNRYRDL